MRILLTFSTKVFVILALIFVCNPISSQISITVTGNTNTTPNLSASYSDLATALTDINAVTAMSGSVILTCNGGTSETAPVKGFVLGSASLNPVLSATNTITINKTGGAVTINAGVGTVASGNANPDGMFVLLGADHVTIDGLTFTDGNVSNPETMEFGVALFKLGAGDGCNNNTIQNCTFNMQRTNNGGSGGPMVEGSVAIASYNSTNTAGATALTPTNGGTLATNGTNSGNRFFSNTINGGNYGIVLIGFAATSGVGPSPNSSTFLGDMGNDIGGTSGSTGNLILNFGGGGATNPSSGIRINQQWSVNVSYNTINNNNGSGVNHATTLRGIFLQGTTSGNLSCSNNNITINGGATTSQVALIENSAGATPLSNIVNVNNNILTGQYLTATTGAFYGIYSTIAPGTLNMNGNSVSGLIYSTNSLTGTGAVYPIYSTGSNASTVLNANNNTVNNISRFGTTGGNTIGIFISGGVSGMATTVNNNTVSNMSIDGTGASSIIYGIQVATGTLVVNDNTIENLSCIKTTGTAAIYGIFNFASSINENYNNNTIRNLSHLGTGIVYGIYSFTTTGVRTMSGNVVHTLTTGGTTIAGIHNISSSPNVFNNKVYDIQSTSSGSPTVSGILQGNLGTAGTTTIYNNLIGDLRAPNASSAGPTSPSVRGINVTTTTVSSNVNIHFNTVYLNASSVGGNFATAALFVTSNATATTAQLYLRNNILINNSTPAGSGFSVSYLRSSTALNNYNDASDYNLFYAGSPTASNLIFYDGTNSDQTLMAFKTRVAPKEANSVTELTTFLSLDGANSGFLHIDPTVGTQVESGGTPVAGVTTDIDGDIRNVSMPDIGADEGDFTMPDIMVYISSTTTQNNISNVPTNSTNQEVIGIEIVTSGLLNPLNVGRIFINTNGTTNTADISNAKIWYTGTSPVFATNTQYSVTQPMPNGTFFFNGNQPLSEGTNYFWLTYDVPCGVTVGNIIDAECPTIILGSVVTPTITAPSGNRQIIPGPLSGTYSIGTSGNFPTLASAVSNLNINGLGGNTTFEILENLNIGAGVVINQWAECGGSGFSLLIKPAASTSPVLTASTSLAAIKINGADRVTIDGSNNGSDSRDMIIENILNSSGGIIWISDEGLLNGANNNTIKNLIIRGFSNNTTWAGIMSSGFATLGGLPTTPNSNNSYLNNEIYRCQNGIVLIGPTGFDINNIISNNILGNTLAADKLGRRGISISQQQNVSVLSNSIVGLTSAAANNDAAAIGVQGTISAGIIRNNIIRDIKNTNTGGWAATAILLNSSSANTNFSIYNNFISDITGHGFGSNWTDNGHGIRINTGGGYNIHFNTVNLNINQNVSGNSAALYISASGLTNLNISNNIFVNTQTTGTRYAVYTSGSSADFSSINYNNYYSAGSALGFLTSIRTTLANWQTATGQDANSVNIQPNFVSSTDLHIDASNNSSLQNLGLPVVGITTDIDGDIRNISTPDIGADEWEQPTDVIDWGNLQWPPSGTIFPQNDYNAFGQAYKDGLTEPDGQAAGLMAWIGYSTNNDDPALWSNWIPASFNVQAGNNDEFIGTFPPNTFTTGTYYYTFRYQLNGGPFRYGGYNAMGGGFWDGIDNVNGVLTVDPCPNISISASSTTVCLGSSIFLLASSDNPNYNYQWNPGMLNGAGQTVTPVIMTTYIVTATDGVNGCVNIDEVTVSVNPTPSIISTSGTPSSICIGGDAQLTVSVQTSQVKDYLFTTGTGEILDPMIGATTIVNSLIDDVPSAIQNIGFNFSFDGASYTQFSVSPDGFIKLGVPAAVSQFTNSIISTTNIPKLYPYWDDMATGTDGNVSFVITGTAPNRILKVQWFVTLPRNETGPANSTFQAWLYETTNVVEFRYGAMNSGAMSASVGLSGNTPASNFNCVTISNNTNSTTVANNSNAGQPENGRMYTFAPLPYDYLWSPNTYLDMDNIFNPMATNIQGAITYVVSVTDQNNCTSTDDVEITIADPIVTDSGDSGPGTLRAAIECVEEEGTITYDQPTTATTILTNPLIISKSLTIEGLSSSEKPEITVNFTGFGSNPGIKIVDGKTVILKDVDVSEMNNPGTNALIEVESIDNEPTTLKVVGSTILEKP